MKYAMIEEGIWTRVVQSAHKLTVYTYDTPAGRAQHAKFLVELRRAVDEAEGASLIDAERLLTRLAEMTH